MDAQTERYICIYRYIGNDRIKRKKKKKKNRWRERQIDEQMGKHLDRQEMREIEKLLPRFPELLDHVFFDILFTDIQSPTQNTQKETYTLLYAISHSSFFVPQHFYWTSRSDQPELRIGWQELKQKDKEENQNLS